MKIILSHISSLSIGNFSFNLILII
jgi:hypothetical protein